MPNPRLLITAVVVEGRSQAEVARSYRVSQAWLSELVARYRSEGEAAFVPRSRRPASSPTATPAATVELIARLRTHLVEAGHDAGADTIAWHLQNRHGITVSRSTVWRQLRTAGLITPQPKKRPKTSYIRFAAEQPNELWQTDFTHWRLAADSPTGSDVRSSPSSMTTPAWRCTSPATDPSPAPSSSPASLTKDLRFIYTAVDETAAETALDAFAEAWEPRYPAIVKLWRSHWTEFVPFLAFPPDVRRVIYTTNLIESLNARLRKVTRNRGQFPSEQAALKVLYLAVRNLDEFRSPSVGTRSSGWKKALQAFTIYFEGRIPTP